MKLHWNLWSAYWLVWLVCFFLIPELTAIFMGHPENTLSAQIWHLEGTGATFFRWVVGSTTVWLFFHMTWRLFQ